MNQFSRNIRRFFRINMPVQYSIETKNPIVNREIYASGADYFPPSVQIKLEAEKLMVLESLSKLQENKELLTKVFNEIIEYAESYGESCRITSQGISPRFDRELWERVSAQKDGFTYFKLLEKEAPKTFNLLQGIEEKYLVFHRRLTYCIEHSTPDYFCSKKIPDTKFKLDLLTERYADAKYDKVPLAQTLLNAGRLMQSYFDIFLEMHHDNLIEEKKPWISDTVNISASGIALHLPKRYQMHQRLITRLYFEKYDQVLEFDSIVVNTQTDNHRGCERVALNFDFPDGKFQNFLLAQLQKYEIQQCLG